MTLGICTCWGGCICAELAESLIGSVGIVLVGDFVWFLCLLFSLFSSASWVGDGGSDVGVFE